MTIILVIAAVCVYDLCGLLGVLYINTQTEWTP